MSARTTEVLRVLAALFFFGAVWALFEHAAWEAAALGLLWWRAKVAAGDSVFSAPARPPYK